MWLRSPLAELPTWTSVFKSAPPAHPLPSLALTPLFPLSPMLPGPSLGAWLIVDTGETLAE